jgi:NAD/NADP transhydrogenase alpha subunit
MASNKAGIRYVPVKTKPRLTKTLFKIVTVGFAGGTAIIAVAKNLGETIEERQVREYGKREAQREADKENVRRIMENSVEAGYEAEDNTSNR